MSQLEDLFVTILVHVKWNQTDFTQLMAEIVSKLF